jgi:hypothetical protein
VPGTYFKRGSHNGICDVCGHKFKFTELMKRWDGLIVCKDDFETDHPQKYIRVRESGLAVPEIRDRPGDVFTEYCTMWSRYAYADLATADCGTADSSSIAYTILYNMYFASIVPDGPFN